MENNFFVGGGASVADAVGAVVIVVLGVISVIPVVVVVDVATVSERSSGFRSSGRRRLLRVLFFMGKQNEVESEPE